VQEQVSVVARDEATDVPVEDVRVDARREIQVLDLSRAGVDDARQDLLVLGDEEQRLRGGRRVTRADDGEAIQDVHLHLVVGDVSREHDGLAIHVDADEHDGVLGDGDRRLIDQLHALDVGDDVVLRLPGGALHGADVNLTAGDVRHHERPVLGAQIEVLDRLHVEDLIPLGGVETEARVGAEVLVLRAVDGGQGVEAILHVALGAAIEGDLQRDLIQPLHGADDQVAEELCDVRTVILGVGAHDLRGHAAGDGDNAVLQEGEVRLAELDVAARPADEHRLVLRLSDRDGLAPRVEHRLLRVTPAEPEDRRLLEVVDELRRGHVIQFDGHELDHIVLGLLHW